MAPDTAGRAPRTMLTVSAAGVVGLRFSLAGLVGWVARDSRGRLGA